MITTAAADASRVEPVTPGDLLGRVRVVREAQRSAEVELLVLSCGWADAHPVLDDAPHAGARDARRADEAARVAERRRIAAGWLADHDPDTPSDYRYDGTGELPADPWVPQVAWDAVAPFAAAMGMSTTAGGRLVDDALFLRRRMPRLWARTLAGRVEAWRARRVAQAAWRQPADVVAALDAEVTPRAHSIGVAGIDRLAEDLLVRLHPEEHELDQLAAQDSRHVTLHPDPTPTGLAEVLIRAGYTDAVDFDRACAAVAEALKVRQVAAGRVPESLDVRRARAVGILADPARALALLPARTTRWTRAGRWRRA